MSEGRQSIAVPHKIVDKPGAPDLDISEGAIAFEGVTFNYGKTETVVQDLNLSVGG